MNDIFITKEEFTKTYLGILDNNKPIKLGSGSFSSVYLYVNKNTNKPVAVKMQEAFLDEHCDSDEIPVSLVMSEIESNRKLKETNSVIPLLAVYKTTLDHLKGPIIIEKHIFYMIFDFGITLADYIKNLR